MNTRKIVRAALLLLSIGTALLLAQDARTVDRGGTGYPFFDRDGNPGLSSKENARSLEVKKDSLNRLWTIWEETAGGRGDIFLARPRENSISPAENISGDLPGSNYSPTLAVSSALEAWAAWVNEDRGTYRLIVKRIGVATSWIIAESPQKPISTPKILADGSGRVWVFWTGQRLGLDEILFSVFSEGRWSPVSSLSANPAVPSFHPAGALDGEGNPWVAWTSFDGDDYEVYVTSWDGRRFRPAEKITDNSRASDGEPSLCFFRKAIPLVAWAQADGSSKRILLSARIESGWAEPAKITIGHKRSEKPVLISEDGKLAVSWKAGEELCLKSLALPPILRNRTPLRKEAPPSLSSPFRDGNRFIAFGDSITYGWIDPPGDVKEKGYPPRLQILLGNLFQEPVVYNEGLPGEPTWEGMSRLVSAVNERFALYLLLMEGTNDVTNTAYSMDSTAFNLKQMLLKSLQYGVFPLISTIIPRKGDRWTDSAKTRTLYLNDKIRELASSLHILLVDNYSSFINYPEASGGWQSLIADPPDNLHPSEDGYQWMADTWYRKIQVIPFPPIDINAFLMVRAGHIQLSWKDDSKILPATGLASYKIYRKSKEENSFASVGSAGVPPAGFQDKSISPEKDYTYVLSSVNADKVEGPLSEPANPVRGDPYAPQNVAFQTLKNRALFYREHINRVTWQANPQNQGKFTIVKYRVYRKKKSEDDARFEPIGETSSSVLQFLDRKISLLSIAESYLYGIAAVDSAGIEGELGKSPG